MNSSSVGTPSKGDEQGRPVRRSVSTPADDRLISRALDSDSDEEGRFQSPWNAMLGNIGDTLVTSDTGSYVYLLSEGEEELATGEDREEVDEGVVVEEGVVEELERADVEKYDEEYSDIVILEDEDSTNRCDDPEKGKSLSSSVISIPSQGTWESDNMDNLVCSGSCQWAWVVANLMFRKYGEKMSRLRNNISDRLINFRSQTFFKSTIMFKPQPLPEDDHVSMMHLMMKT